MMIGTKRAVRALTVSLVTMVCCILFFLFSSKERAPTVEEIPDHLRTPPASVSPPPRARNRGERRESQDTVPNVRAPPQEENDEVSAYRKRLKDLRNKKKKRLVFNAVVYSADGQPVEGAPVGVEQLGYEMPSLQLFGGLHNEARTNDDGTVTSGRKWYYENTSRDTMFAVAAYHETYGTAYAEYTLEELESTEVMLQLDRGQSVIGDVLFADGRPVTNIRVSLFFSWKKDQPSLNGLSDKTDNTGRFRISGVRFGNTPQFLSIRERTNSRTQKYGIDRSSFNEDNNTWNVGVIVFDPTE